MEFVFRGEILERGGQVPETTAETSIWQLGAADHEGPAAPRDGCSSQVCGCLEMGICGSLLSHMESMMGESRVVVSLACQSQSALSAPDLSQ